MRLRPDVLEQSQLIEQVGGAGLEHLAAELPLEVRVPLEHEDIGAALGQEQAQHEAGGPAADDAGIHANRGHGRRSLSAEIVAYGADACSEIAAAG